MDCLIFIKLFFKSKLQQMCRKFTRIFSDGSGPRAAIALQAGMEVRKGTRREGRNKYTRRYKEEEEE